MTGWGMFSIKRRTGVSFRLPVSIVFPFVFIYFRIPVYFDSHPVSGCPVPFLFPIKNTQQIGRRIFPPVLSVFILNSMASLSCRLFLHPAIEAELCGRTGRGRAPRPDEARRSRRARLLPGVPLEASRRSAPARGGQGAGGRARAGSSDGERRAYTGFQGMANEKTSGRF